MTSEVLTPLLVFIVGACLIYLAIPDSEELGITHQASAHPCPLLQADGPARGTPLPRGRVVALIDTQHDDEAILRAEDEAIAAADTPVPEVVIPTGDALARLIESYDEPPLQQG
jgi:hypothetical protein